VSVDDPSSPSEQSELGVSLFAAERRRQVAGVPHEQAERIYARVLATAGVASAIAVAGASAAAKSGGAAGTAATTAGGAASAAGGAASALSIKVVAGLAIASYVAGAGTVVLVRPNPVAITARPLAPEVDASALGVPPVSPRLVETAAPVAQEDAGVVAPTPLPSPSALVVPGSSSDTALAEERSLIDRARSALARGDSSSSLEACDLHARKFPRGRLSEERELLAVQALVRSHALDAARARAGRFRTNYPKSMFLPALSRMVPEEK
jgi:hypothetical protein